MRQYALNVPMLEREVPEAYKWLCEHSPHLRLRVDPELEEEREINLVVGMWASTTQIDWASLSVERFDEQFKAHPQLCGFLAHLSLFDVVDISSSKRTVMGFRSRHHLGMYHTIILEEEAAPYVYRTPSNPATWRRSSQPLWCTTAPCLWVESSTLFMGTGLTCNSQWRGYLQ